MKTSPRIEKAVRLEIDILDMLHDYMRNSRIAGLSRRTEVVRAVMALLDNSRARNAAGLRPKGRGAKHDPRKLCPKSPECMEVWRFLIGEISRPELNDYLAHVWGDEVETRTIDRFIAGARQEILLKVALESKSDADFNKRFGIDPLMGTGW